MMKVFLVDDEIAIRENLRNSFPWEEKGYQLVGEAPDGEMALPMLRDLNADILLTDIRMPFMDGMKLCEEVQRTMPWVERIILSGYDDFAYAQKAISLGVKEYLLKPVTAAELEAALNRVSRQIEEKRRDRENLTALRERLSCVAIAEACAPMLGEAPERGWCAFTYDYLRERLFPNRGFAPDAGRYDQGALTFLIILQAFLDYERTAFSFDPIWDFQFLSGEEYAAFDRAEE